MLKYRSNQQKTWRAGYIRLRFRKGIDMSNLSKSKKAGFIAAIVVIAIIFSVLTFGLVYKLSHYKFFSQAESHMQAPGLEDGLVQQGFDYIPAKIGENDEIISEAIFLTSGYMKDGSASRIYITVGNGTPSYVSLYNSDGTEYVGHAGGIAHYGDLVYLADEENDGDVAVFSLADVLGTDENENDGKATVKTTIAMPEDFESSFCTVYSVDGNPYLFVGRFAKEGHEKYGVVDGQKVTVGDETNTSLILAYQLGGSAENGLLINKPAFAISIPNLVQGMCFAGDNRIILSTSWSLASSHLYYYEIYLGTAATGTDVVIDDVQIPVHFLGSDALKYEIKCPPMAEEMVFIDGRVYIMNESASKKYIFGNFIGGRKVYSIPAGDEQFAG